MKLASVILKHGWRLRGESKWGGVQKNLVILTNDEALFQNDIAMKRKNFYFSMQRYGFSSNQKHFWAFFFYFHVCILLESCS